MPSECKSKILISGCWISLRGGWQDCAALLEVGEEELRTARNGDDVSGPQPMRAHQRAEEGELAKHLIAPSSASSYWSRFQSWALGASSYFFCKSNSPEAF